MPSWERLDDFFQPETAGGFGLPAVLRYDVSGDEKTIIGIFDDPYLDTQLGEYIADTSAPRFTCKEIDVLDVRRGDYLIHGGKTYNIMAVPQGDGTGLAILRLEIDE